MLKYVNQFWRFNTQQELDSFLKAASQSDDEYLLERAGKAKNGSFYAFGSVNVARKDGQPEKPESENNVPEVI